MIICFTGTGNSLAVAKRLSRELDDKIVRLENELLVKPRQCSIECADQVRIVWVFPVYSWGVPPVVRNVIRQLRLMHGEGLQHFMVATCGDDAGYTHRQWRHLIKHRGWLPMGAFTVQMPNVYISMKGFDVDEIDVMDSKLNEMPGRVAEIAARIKKGSTSNDVFMGQWGWVKSWIVYPWFVRRAMSPRRFHVTDSCVGCGLCARHCPMTNISMWKRRPTWHEQCAHCLRCYHICPHHAVAYGKHTADKGQYLNPDLMES